jgi:hypothetical protein
VVCAWFCPEQGLGYFLTRQVPRGSALAPQAIAADLAARFPCAHRGR